MKLNLSRRKHKGLDVLNKEFTLDSTPELSLHEGKLIANLLCDVPFARTWTKASWAKASKKTISLCKSERRGMPSSRNSWSTYCSENQETPPFGYFRNPPMAHCLPEAHASALASPVQVAAGLMEYKGGAWDSHVSKKSRMHKLSWLSFREVAKGLRMRIHIRLSVMIMRSKSSFLERGWCLAFTNLLPTGIEVPAGVCVKTKASFNASLTSCQLAGDALYWVSGGKKRSAYNQRRWTFNVGWMEKHHCASPTKRSMSFLEILVWARSSAIKNNNFWRFASCNWIKPALKSNRHPIHTTRGLKMHFFHDTGTLKTKQRRVIIVAVNAIVSAAWVRRKSSTNKYMACLVNTKWWKNRSKNEPRRPHQCWENLAPKGQTL